MAKVAAFFKKVGKAIADCAKKVWAAIVSFCKKAWAAVKAINWTAPVRPLIAWSVYGGVVALAVVLMLIFWL